MFRKTQEDMCRTVSPKNFEAKQAVSLGSEKKIIFTTSVTYMKDFINIIVILL